MSPNTVWLVWKTQEYGRHLTKDTYITSPSWAIVQSWAWDPDPTNVILLVGIGPEVRHIFQPRVAVGRHLPNLPTFEDHVKILNFCLFWARLTSQRRSCSAGHSCIPWGKISSPSLVSTDRFSSLNSQSRPEPLWKNGTLTPARRLLSCGKWGFYCRVGLNSCFQWKSVQ